MIKKEQFIIIASIVFQLIGWLSPEVSNVSAETKLSDSSKAFGRNNNIGRGINFGNALEAPNEGEWGLVIKNY